MTLLESYMAAVASPVALLGEVFRQDRPLAELGMEESEATWLHGLAEVYFGKTKFTRRQRNAVTSLRRKGHSLSHLRLLEDKVRQVKGADYQWQLRLSMLQAPLGTIKQFKALLNKRTKEVKAQANPSRPPKPLSVTTRPHGPSSITLTGEPALVRAMAEALREVPDPLAEIVNHGVSSPATSPDAPQGEDDGAEVQIARVGADVIVHPIVQIPLEVSDRVLMRPDGEVMLKRSDGVEISAIDFMRSKISPEWGFVLLHPVEGPVELGRGYRLASHKQRIMLMGESATCQFGDCDKPAEECQVHHIHPWKHGGVTDPKNLTLLCAAHNRMNNDDFGKPKPWGYVERAPGGFRRVYRETRPHAA